MAKKRATANSNKEPPDIPNDTVNAMLPGKNGKYAEYFLSHAKKEVMELHGIERRQKLLLHKIKRYAQQAVSVSAATCHLSHDIGAWYAPSVFILSAAQN